MDDTKALGRRLTANYALIQCIYNMGYCCVINFASVFLLARAFTNSEVGITLTVANALNLVLQPFVASFADKTQKVALRSIVAALLVLTTTLSLLLLVTPALFLPTAILYTLLFCFHVTQYPLITSLSLEHINDGVPLNFSLARGIGSFAFAMLAIVTGFLVDDYGASIIMAINAGVGIIGIVLVATFRKAHRRKISDGVEERASGLIEFSNKNKRFMAVVCSIALLFFSHILINTYTIQIIRNVGGTSADMGIASAIGGFLELPAMALFPLLLLRMGSAGTIMKLSCVFMVVKALLTLLAPTVFWVYVAQCFQFFAFAMFVPSSVYYVNEVIAGIDKVKGQTYMVMAISVSGMIGNFAGGLMLDSGGVPFMLTVGFVVSAVGLVMLLFVDGFTVPSRRTVRSSR